MPRKIYFFDRYQEKLVEEKVYGSFAVKMLYCTRLGAVLAYLAARLKFLGGIYGAMQGSFISKYKINPFIKKYNINMDEFVVTQYSSFNDFFIRKFKPSKRQFTSERHKMPAFCEGRYYGYDKCPNGDSLPIKGKYLSASRLLGEEQRLASVFQDGPVLLARLCPTDYHRFHYPDDGNILQHYKIDGHLHSVNPIAVWKMPDIFCTNKRDVTIIESANFGKLAYIEIGAICVGKIVQTCKSKMVHRGQEKGLFMFGGSCVVLMGQPGAWVPSADMLSRSRQGVETYVKLGDVVANLA